MLFLLVKTDAVPHHHPEPSARGLFWKNFLPNPHQNSLYNSQKIRYYIQVELELVDISALTNNN